LFSEICTHSVLISCDAATSNGPNEYVCGSVGDLFAAHAQSAIARSPALIVVGTSVQIGLKSNQFCNRLIYNAGQGTVRHGAAGQSSEQLSPFDTIVAGSFTPPRHAYDCSGGAMHVPVVHSILIEVAHPAGVLNSDHAVTVTDCGVGAAVVVVGFAVLDSTVGACSNGPGCDGSGSLIAGCPGAGCAIDCDGLVALE
jgi:hypothetical protein